MCFVKRDPTVAGSLEGDWLVAVGGWLRESGRAELVVDVRMLLCEVMQEFELIDVLFRIRARQETDAGLADRYVIGLSVGTIRWFGRSVGAR